MVKLLKWIVFVACAVLMIAFLAAVGSVEPAKQPDPHTAEGRAEMLRACEVYGRQWRFKTYGELTEKQRTVVAFCNLLELQQPTANR